MARLIDADELIKTLIKEEWQLDQINTVENFEEIILDKIPTAYDPEKVIEELEKDCFSPRDYYGYAVDIEKAIEIVEKGGIE